MLGCVGERGAEDGERDVAQLRGAGQLSQDLPTWTHFEQATEIVTEDERTKSVPCGPDIAGELVDSVQQYVDAGYDHLYFHQIGDDQDGFFRFWESELSDALGTPIRA